MKHALMAAWVLGVAACAAMGQWPTEGGSPLVVADRSGEQVQPKIRAAHDGGCWVTWFDNAAGGYDVYLQRLDRAGGEQFPHNGILLADLAFSSTQDYDLRVDHEGNAVVVFRSDTAMPGTEQIVAQKVSPSGGLLWGGAGLIVSEGGSDKNSPKCAVLDDNRVVVGWTTGSPPATALQVVSAAGERQLGAAVVYADTGSPQRPLQLSDLRASTPGTFIALFVRCSGTNCVTSNKHLHAQRFDAADLAALWDRDTGNAVPGEALVVFDVTSIQVATFPAFFEDGQGGGVFAWYENGGARQAYVQRLSAEGVEAFPHNGVAVMVTPGLLQLSAGASYDAATGDVYVAVKTSNVGQSQWGVRAARITAEGQRAWGDGGVEVSGLVPVQSSFEMAAADPGLGADFAWFENSGGLVGRLLAAGYQADGSPRTPGIVEVSSVSTVKGRMSVDRGVLGNALIAWHDNASDANNILAQSLRRDGTLGAPDAGCAVDFNGDGAVDPDDLGDFINCYFAAPACDRADFNGDGAADPDDLGDFINAYFTSSC